MEDPEEVLDSWFCIGIALAFVVTWRMSQWTKDILFLLFFVYLSPRSPPKTVAVDANPNAHGENGSPIGPIFLYVCICPHAI